MQNSRKFWIAVGSCLLALLVSAITIQMFFTPPVTDCEDRAGSSATAQSADSGVVTIPDLVRGNGGPILVAFSPEVTYARYYAEILRNEGLNQFIVNDVSALSADYLGKFDIVLLAVAELTSKQVVALTEWVEAGGNLVALSPPQKLSSLLGVTIGDANQRNGYIQIDTSETSPGAGLVSETLQYFGPAKKLLTTDAVEVARLYSGPEAATRFSAITFRDVGTSGGTAIAYAFDLAKSVVYARQGNPDWCGQDRDGKPPIRSNDLYFGESTSDPQPDWVDLSKVAIPQADEQQRLLVHLLLTANENRKPLPRFWYFPRGEKAVVVMTGDDHANNGTQGRFDQFIAASPPGCSVEDWECVRGTSYLFWQTPLSDAAARQYVDAGFEVGLHINTNCEDYDEAELRDIYDTQISKFAAEFPSVPAPATQRHHCIAWSDWATAARIQLSHGMRFDTSYYYWPPDWVLDRPGFFTGSGMPMRFAGRQGDVIDVYQAATQMTDESGQTYPFTVDALLDKALGPEEYYGAFTANMHTDEAQIPESDAIVASAQRRDVPIVSSQQMLDWLDGRNGSAFSDLAWNGSALSFGVSRDPKANGLRILVPFRHGSRTVHRVEREGVPLEFSIETLKGRVYAVLNADTGAYLVHYSADGGMVQRESGNSEPR